MTAFSDAFEERKNQHLKSMIEEETVYITPSNPINFKKLFVASVLLNLLLIFAVREYWSILGTAEYAIYNLRNNTNLSMHKDYLRQVRQVYCP